MSKAINRISIVETSIYILQVNFRDADDPSVWSEEWHRMNSTQQYTRMSEALEKVKAIKPGFFRNARVRILRVNQVTTLTATRPFEEATRPAHEGQGETK